MFLFVSENQGVPNEVTFSHRFEQRINGQFLKVGKSQTKEISKLSFYEHIKIHHCLEKVN